MAIKHANNFSTTLNGSITNVATSMTLTSVTGAPALGSGVTAYFTITDGTNYEIVSCSTAVSTATYSSLTRGAQSTTAQSWSSGATVFISATADSIDRKLDAPASITAYAVLCGGTSATAVAQQVSGVGTSGQVLTSAGAGALPTWQTPSTSGITVTGTSSRISVTGGGGATPTIDIDSAYVGQTSITTLGTVGTGTWNATAIGPTKGGTGLTSFVANGVLYASASNTWSTTSSVNNAVLGSGAGGVPAFVTTLPTTVQQNITTVGTVTSGTWSATTVAVNKGGTGVTSVTTAPAASVWAGWDASKNFSANLFISGYTSIATAAGTTTLTVASAQKQYFTGTTTQTVTLPVTTTLVTGFAFDIVNNSTGTVTVNSSGGNLVISLTAGTRTRVTCIQASGTTASSWDATPISSGGSGTVNSGTANQLAYYSSTGTAVSGLTSANSGVLVTDGSGVPSISSTLPSGISATNMTLTTPAIGTVSSGNVTAASGAVVQVVSTATGTVATGTTQIPIDNSIPQQTEGDQYMSVSITPKSSTNKLTIIVTTVGTSSVATAFLTTALFQDSTANALAAAGGNTPAANNMIITTFTYNMTAGTTSSTTFKVRMGAGSAGTTTFNGASGSQFLGGVFASGITIIETKP